MLSTSAVDHELLIRDPDDFLFRQEASVHGHDLHADLRHAFREATKNGHLTLGSSIQHTLDAGSNLAIAFTRETT
jgi:hypothetical protein